MKRPAYHRCPGCNALIRAGASECSECRIVHETPVSQNEKVWEPRNPVVRFFWGLGIPPDVWILALLATGWFFVFTVAEGALSSLGKVIVGLGFPFALILGPDVLASIRFPGYGSPLDPIDPIAVKIFAWVWVMGAHVWFIYSLVAAP